MKNLFKDLFKKKNEISSDIDQVDEKLKTPPFLKTIL